MSHKYKCRNLLENITNSNPTTCKKLIQYDQMWFSLRMQDWLRIWKLSNVIHCVNKMTEETHVTIQIDKEKAFDKIQHPLMMKSPTN